MRAWRNSPGSDAPAQPVSPRARRPASVRRCTVQGGFQVKSTTTSRTPWSFSSRSRMPGSTRPPPAVTRKSYTGRPRCGIVTRIVHDAVALADVVDVAHVDDVGVDLVELFVAHFAERVPDRGLERRGLAASRRAWPVAPVALAASSRGALAPRATSSGFRSWCRSCSTFVAACLSFVAAKPDRRSSAESRCRP